MARSPRGQTPISRARRDDRRDALTTLLSDRRVRLTQARRAVLAVLSEASMPLSAAEIHARVVDRRADLVSVYRTLHLMLDLGFVHMADASRACRTLRRSPPPLDLSRVRQHRGPRGLSPRARGAGRAESRRPSIATLPRDRSRPQSFRRLWALRSWTAPESRVELCVQREVRYRSGP